MCEYECRLNVLKSGVFCGLGILGEMTEGFVGLLMGSKGVGEEEGEGEGEDEDEDEVSAQEVGK